MQPDDFVTYKDLWASVGTWSDQRKRVVFEQVVARLSQFSEESVTNILEGLDAPYKSIVWGIWFKTCDLRKYSLQEMRKLVADTDASNAASLWERWLSQRDLSEINLVAFAKAIADMSPAIQAQCLRAFVQYCRNMMVYGIKEWETVRKVLSSYATQPFAVSAGSQIASRNPLFQVGDTVKILGSQGETKVTSSINQKGEWYYWLQNKFQYYPERQLRKS